MAGIPYFTIVPCCPNLGEAIIPYFNIPDAVANYDGVWVYNGPTAVVNGILFTSGFCYTIEFQGVVLASYPQTPTPATYTDAEKQCTFSGCEDCNSLLPNAFEVYNCCDSANTITLNLDAEFTIDGVYSYDGLTPFTIGDFIFEPGSCYSITFVGNSVTTTGPDFKDFTYEGTDCVNSPNCPSCSVTEQYLAFTSCCEENTILYFRPDEFSTYVNGVYEYLGTPINGLENICYSLTLYDLGVAPILDVITYNALPEAPAFVENVTFDTKSNTNTDCADYTLECPSCKKKCYTLYNCDGTYFNTTVDLLAYVGTFISVSNSEGPIPGTWFVIPNNGACDNAVEDITVDLTPPVPCDCRCFEITGQISTLLYINCEGEVIKDATQTKFCSLIYPFVTGTPGQYQVIEGLDCVDGECPTICYKLTNCDTGEVINTITDLSSYYNLNQVVTLLNNEGCWQIDINQPEECDCPINVTVLTYFSDCPTCLGITAYKLTGCDQTLPIIYTTSDLSLYVGKTIEFNCGCYTVELINYQPPTDIPVIPDYSFDNCTICTSIIYKLVDCLDPQNVIYTTTDLAGWTGTIIKIENCDSCFTIEETREPGTIENITVVESYRTCNACTENYICVCSRIKNYDTVEHVYDYIDCNSVERQITLQPGESSGKLCLFVWLTTYPTDNIEYFGNCTETVKFQWDCPKNYPIRKVKPGYKTPVCSTDKYEKITCKASEILYKQVMTLRYGISNCCPEEDDKWLIKKELIDLQALVDPNYTCKPSSCGCTVPDCGCTPLKTCNS